MHVASFSKCDSRENYVENCDCSVSLHYNSFLCLVYTYRAGMLIVILCAILILFFLLFALQPYSVRRTLHFTASNCKHSIKQFLFVCQIHMFVIFLFSLSMCRMFCKHFRFPITFHFPWTREQEKLHTLLHALNLTLFFWNIIISNIYLIVWVRLECSSILKSLHIVPATLCVPCSEKLLAAEKGS